jgi:hypothetical protein
VYSPLPFFVLGFQGCDKSVCSKIISGFDKLHPSGNDYDWLGNGIYFRENDPRRALDYAAMIQRKLLQPCRIEKSAGGQGCF